MSRLRNLPNLIFDQSTYGKNELTHAKAVQLCEKIRLILDRVGRRGEPNSPRLVCFSLRIVSRGDTIVVVALALLKAAKFYVLIAHHIGVWRQSLAQSVDDVPNYFVPILLLQIDKLEFAAIASGHGRRHLPILLRLAVPFALRSVADLNIKEIGRNTLLFQQVNSNGAVHATRNKCSCLHTSHLRAKLQFSEKPP